MEENIMTTAEELVETAEDFDFAESGNGVGIGVALGAAMIGGAALAYKFIVKPIAAKIKAKKAAKAEADTTPLALVEGDSTESDEE